MRESSRNRILDGAIRLIERDGVTAVTFDAVAAETGLTRGGVIYHFPSREDLILATHEHLAASWEAHLQELAPDPDNPTDRHIAYITSCLRDATRAELLLMLESRRDPRLAQVWSGLIDHWAPPVPRGDDPRAMARFVARITSDGLWTQQAITGLSLPSALKAQMLETMLAMLRP